MAIQSATTSHRSTPRVVPFGFRQLLGSVPGAVRKLDPLVMWRSPVMFIVEAGAALTTLLGIAVAITGAASAVPVPFIWWNSAWLWCTVLFATLAESIAEGRGKAQAASLRESRTITTANRLVDYDGGSGESEPIETVASAELLLGDTVVVTAGELIPGDGDIIWGIASVDESAITGESAPVIRESGGDRSAVTGGTRVLSDRVVVRITSNQG
jgi:potassium-transporting ATPase ATP-binding subunit